MRKVLQNMDIRYTHMPILNFFYLALQDQTNEYYTWGIFISFILLAMLKVAKQHGVRLAKETGRVKIEEIAEDMWKEKGNSIIIMPLYILFLGTFIYIAFYQTWQYPYTHLLVLINFTALITQLTVFYFEREMVYNVFIKPRLESRKKTVNKATK